MYHIKRQFQEPTECRTGNPLLTKWSSLGAAYLYFTIKDLCGNVTFFPFSNRNWEGRPYIFNHGDVYPNMIFSIHDCRHSNSVLRGVITQFAVLINFEVSRSLYFYHMHIWRVLNGMTSSKYGRYSKIYQTHWKMKCSKWLNQQTKLLAAALSRLEYLSTQKAVSANVIIFPCTRLEIKFILSYLILS